MLLVLNLNSKLSILSIIILFIYGNKSLENSLKAIIYSFLFSQLNSSIFHSSIGELRLTMNLYFIGKIAINLIIVKRILKSITSAVCGIYLLFNIISAMIVSWLPFVSIFKGVYFTTGFLSIFLCAKVCSEERIIMWIRKYFITIISINSILMIIPVGYSRNGAALNGMVANTNGLGIITVMGVALILYSSTLEK